MMGLPGGTPISDTGDTSQHGPIAAAEPPPSALPRSTPRLLWDAWKAYTKRAGGYQTTVLLSLLYYLVLGPSAVFSGLTGHRLLDLDPRPRASYWIARPAADRTLEALERQF